MKILVVFCYIAAGILALIASVLLIQLFTVPAAIENATLGYRMMLGLSGPVVDRLLSSLAGLAQAFFCPSAGLLYTVGGVTFAMVWQLMRVEQQSQRIQELEVQISRRTDDSEGTPGPGAGRVNAG